MLRKLLKLPLVMLMLVSAGMSPAVTHSEDLQTHVQPTPPPVLAYTLLRQIPREKNHFTEGMVFVGGNLFESTGHYGNSSLYRFKSPDFSLVKKTDLPQDVFGEGLTAIDNRLYQLSWKGGDLFIYDLELQQQDRLPIPGDGWGLTTDGKDLIMSDGSDTLYFRDALTAHELRRVTVMDATGKTWQNLNELEWVNGVILANVWHLDTVLIIDPTSGTVTGQYQLEKLSQIAGKLMPGRTGEQVLNGMAWNPLTNTLLVTGKDWPLWFEIALVPTPSIKNKGH